MVDLVKLMISISLALIVRKIDGSETIRRTFGLRDMSCYSIDITLWLENCQIEGAKLTNLRVLKTPPTLAIKGGRVTKFNGRTIGTTSNTSLFINPIIEELFFSKHGFMMMDFAQCHHP